MHIKRKTIGIIWPVPKTGTKYMATPSHEHENSVPLIILVRDILKMVKTKKELKKIINEKLIKINGKVIKETNYPLSLYDSLSLAKSHYKILMSGRKLTAIETSEDESNNKIYKIIGKKMLADKKVQINLSSGKNILSNEKVNTGDFVIIKDNKIAKVISLKKDSEVIVIAGKQMGKTGKIKEILEQSNEKVAVIKTQKGEIKANIKNIFAKD